MRAIQLDHLPGQFHLTAGNASDYRQLERFHYRYRPPATFASVRAVRFTEKPHARPVPTPPGPTGQGRLVAVAVLSYPVPSLRVREQTLNIQALPAPERLRFVNANLRTISRVIVHPQFRALGLASTLVRHLCDTCPTRYIEALAVMGRAHPLFERAGMTRIDPDPPDPRKPLYYILDRLE